MAEGEKARERGGRGERESRRGMRKQITETDRANRGGVERAGKVERRETELRSCSL